METSHLLQGPKSVMQARKKIGPKSVMERRLSGNKSSALSREVITQLEKHFLANITKSSPQQMGIWAAQLKVNFQSVDEWFRAKWKAKIDCKQMKTKQKEELDEE